MKGINQMTIKNTGRGSNKGGTSSTGTRSVGTSRTETKGKGIGSNSKPKEGRMK